MTNTPKTAPTETKESVTPAQTDKSGAVGPAPSVENDSAAKPAETKK